MGGSARKRDKPQPSYVDGKPRDPQIEQLQDGSNQRSGLLNLLRKAVQKPARG